jgi:hypothetical protein
VLLDHRVLGGRRGSLLVAPLYDALFVWADFDGLESRVTSEGLIQGGAFRCKSLVVVMVRDMEVLVRLVPEDGVLTLLSQGVKGLVRDHPTLLEGVYQRIHLRGLGVVDRNLLILDED